METAVNRDHSGEILLRVSPESGRFIVEEHKKNGVVSYKEISPLDFYNTIYGSFDQEHFLRSGLLPPNCLQVSFCGEDKYFVLWNPELRADIFYGFSYPAYGVRHTNPTGWPCGRLLYRRCGR